MKLKFNLSPEVKNKFQDTMTNALGEKVWAASIREEDSQYRFGFRMYGSDWHMELDKNPHDRNLYTLHCSKVELNLPIDYIKDLQMFCKQLVRIRQMQMEACKY